MAAASFLVLIRPLVTLVIRLTSRPNGGKVPGKQRQIFCNVTAVLNGVDRSGGRGARVCSYCSSATTVMLANCADDYGSPGLLRLFYCLTLTRGPPSANRGLRRRSRPSLLSNPS